jgi:hypothetical protein
MLPITQVDLAADLWADARLATAAAELDAAPTTATASAADR